MGNDFFTLDDRAHWKSGEQHTTSGRCSRGWISFLLTIAYFQAYALLLMVTFKVLSYLDALPSKMMKCPMKCPTRKQKTDVDAVEKADDA